MPGIFRSIRIRNSSGFACGPRIMQKKPGTPLFGIPGPYPSESDAFIPPQLFAMELTRLDHIFGREHIIELLFAHQFLFQYEVIKPLPVSSAVLARSVEVS